MVEVVGKSNDPVVQCENCRNLVKYVENDVEYLLQVHLPHFFQIWKV